MAPTKYETDILKHLENILESDFLRFGKIIEAAAYYFKNATPNKKKAEEEEDKNYFNPMKSIKLTSTEGKGAQHNDYSFRLDNRKYIYFFYENNLDEKTIGRVKIFGGPAEIYKNKKWEEIKNYYYMPNIDQKVRNFIRAAIIPFVQ